MNRNEAIQILKTYPADTEIGMEYDDDQQLRDALAVAVPGFEYPDWCTRSIKHAIAYAEKGVTAALADHGATLAGSENEPAARFSDHAKAMASPDQEKRDPGDSGASRDGQGKPLEAQNEGESRTKLVRAVLIDPVARAVQFVRTTGQLDGPDGLYQLIGCNWVEAIDVGHAGRGADQIRLTAWIDEEGLLKDWSEQSFCLTPFYPEPLAGRILLVADRPSGESPVDIPMGEHGLAGLSQTVMWLHPKTVEVTAPFIETIGEDGQIKREPLGNQTADGKWTYAAH